MNTYHISRFEKSLVDFISEATARVYLQYFLSFVNDTGSSRSACTCRHHTVTAQGIIHLCAIPSRSVSLNIRLVRGFLPLKIEDVSADERSDREDCKESLDTN